METVPVDIHELQGWIQIVTSGGFGALAWYLIAYALPKMQTRFDDHSDRQQKSFEATVERIITQHERHIDRLCAAFKAARSKDE